MTKSTLLGEKSFQGLKEPTHSQSIRELNAVVDGSRSQDEEFVD